MKPAKGFAILSVQISESVKEALDAYIHDKIGTVKSMGCEVDKILSAFLSRQPKRTHTQIERMKNRAIIQLTDIINEMKAEGYTNQIIVEKRISEKGNVHWGRSSDLASIVARVKGTDQRSIDKYITMLVDLGVLTSPIAVPNSRKIIFTVDFGVLEEEKPLRIEIQSRGDVK